MRFPSALLAIVIVLASACSKEPAASSSAGDRAGGADVPRFADGTPKQRPEFEAIAAALTPTDSPFFGTAERRKWDEAYRRPDLNVAQRLEVMGHLALELLKEGEVDRATKLADEFTELLRANRELVRDSTALFRVRGLTYLRQAEVRNCVARHNADCCILPLRGGGIHTERVPADSARDAYEAYLRFDPDNLAVRWLLNIAHQALGTWPDALDPRLLIPPSAFASEYPMPRFVDVGMAAGVDVFNLSGGCIADDFDGDGLLDVVTSTLDPVGPMVYYHNLGNGRFLDRSVPSRLDDQLGGLNCIGGDYDNDGDVDVLVLRGAWLFDAGRIRNSLIRNNGDGTFTDVTREAGLAEPARPTQAAAWGDFDLDGDLDLFVGNESRVGLGDPEGDYPAQLFRNNGDGTFTDVAAGAGVTNDRYCKAVSVGDFDNDGDLDVYLSNFGPNRLYRNNGDMTFRDVAAGLGVAEPTDKSFAAWFFDYDNDGWLDIFAASYQSTIDDLAAFYLDRPFKAPPPRLYRNRGDGTFTDVTLAAGLNRPIEPMGANFGDVDNDGWIDIYLATGEPNYEALMPNVCLRNDRGKRFQDVTTAIGLGHLQKGHGVAFADFDHDGDQDIYHQLGGFYPGDGFRNALFVNPGHGHHWLTVRLVGTESPRNGYGARVMVRVDGADGAREIHRSVGSVSSFGGSPARQEIGLGNAERIERVEIRWPRSPRPQVMADVPLDTIIEVVEGQDGFRELELPRFALPVAGTAGPQTTLE